MAEQLEVVRDGERLEGFEEFRIARSIDDLAGEFTLTFPEVAPGNPLERKLLRGDQVQLYIDSELVLSGTIFRRTKAYNGTTNAITVTGRDVLADLIDCSATNEPGQWRGARVATIAKEILSAFSGIGFREDLSDKALGSVVEFSLQTGETAFSALDRLARMRGLLLASDLEGGLYFTRPGTERAPIALERGVNVEAGSIEEDESGRFSRYIVHGAGPTPAYWDVGLSPGQAFRVEVEDAGVLRSRPLVIHAEKAADEAELRARVNFEASVRAARGLRVVYELPDLTFKGHLWRPGELVAVYDPILEVGSAAGSSIDLLVGAVNWSRSATGGSRTVLELYRPGAFTPEPPKAKKGAKTKASKVQELWLE